VAEAYVKSSHTAAGDKFGVSVAISGDAMVVGAYEEPSRKNRWQLILLEYPLPLTVTSLP